MVREITCPGNRLISLVYRIHPEVFKGLFEEVLDEREIRRRLRQRDNGIRDKNLDFYVRAYFRNDPNAISLTEVIAYGNIPRDIEEARGLRKLVRQEVIDNLSFHITGLDVQRLKAKPGTLGSLLVYIDPDEVKAMSRAGGFEGCHLCLGKYQNWLYEQVEFCRSMARHPEPVYRAIARKYKQMDFVDAVIDLDENHLSIFPKMNILFRGRANW